MEHYVTLFDSFFLPQGLALHMSMERHAKPYILWILCVDKSVFLSLKKLNLANVRLLQLSEHETDELKKVKPIRTIAEYCWTLTPFAPRFVFEVDLSVQRVTYIDADVWFRKNPRGIFEEFEISKKNVLITDHAYAPEYDQSAQSGQFCVQFVIFTRQGGEKVRKWWEDKCVDWCYARIEDGKFGDQKYLDDWPERFAEDVHVLQQQHFMLAPWNASRFPYSSAIIFHFHGLRIGRKIILNDVYYLPKATLENVYSAYVRDLRFVICELKNNSLPIKYQISMNKLRITLVKSLLRNIVRKIENIFIKKTVSL